MKNRTTLLLSGIAVILLLTLASTLENLEFGDGYRINLESVGAGAFGGGGFPISERVFVGFTSTLMLLSLLFTVVSLFTREGRRRVLSYAAFSAALALGFALLLEIVPEEPEEVPLRETEQAHGTGGIPGAEDYGDSGPELPEKADERAVWATVAFAALFAGAAAYGLYRKRFRTSLPGLSEETAAAAENAERDLSHGSEPGDVIVRTYMELERIAGEHLSVSREDRLTPREFIEVLAYRGVPRQPLERLVSLFEQVRYGNAESTEHMRSTAEQTLREITDGTRPTGQKVTEREI